MFPNTLQLAIQANIKKLLLYYIKKNVTSQTYASIKDTYNKNYVINQSNIHPDITSINEIPPILLINLIQYWSGIKVDLH